MYRSISIVVCCIAAVTGCAVGPDFRPPESPRVKKYTPAPLPEETPAAKVPCGEAQCFRMGEEIPEQWWTLFHSKALDGLVRLAIAGNPTAAAAEAALRQARENLRARWGSAWVPALDGEMSASREKFSAASFGQSIRVGVPPFDLYNASVNVSYVLDFFGGQRRELEALAAQVDYRRFQLAGTYLTLTANVVTTAVQEASLRAQIQATREILADQQQAYELVRRQFELGGISRTDVLAQETQLAQTRATLPPLEKSLAQTRHQLAILLGKFPGDAGSLPVFDLREMTLPVSLPVSLPSSLVRQRPDIQAAEALLHAASAQVGVATANLYPRITLTGSYGSQTNQSGNLFTGDSIIWNLGTGLTQPLFHGGELIAKRRAAVAAYDQALSLYKEAVLQAFRDVADSLRALELDASALRAQLEVETAAQDTLELTRKQFQFGAVSYLSLLDAQRQYQQARIRLVQAQAARFADTAALFQALGGGWWTVSGDSRE